MNKRYYDQSVHERYRVDSGDNREVDRFLIVLFF